MTTLSKKCPEKLLFFKYKFDIGYDGPSDNDFELGYGIDETELKFKIGYMPDSLHFIDYGLSAKLYAVNPG